jgi:hypothetical protein
MTGYPLVLLGSCSEADGISGLVGVYEFDFHTIEAHAEMQCHTIP